MMMSEWGWWSLSAVVAFCFINAAKVLIYRIRRGNRIKIPARNNNAMCIMNYPRARGVAWVGG